MMKDVVIAESEGSLGLCEHGPGADGLASNQCDFAVGGVECLVEEVRMIESKC